jgi:hypothetical protein
MSGLETYLGKQLPNIVKYEIEEDFKYKQVSITMEHKSGATISVSLPVNKVSSWFGKQGRWFNDHGTLEGCK